MNQFLVKNSNLEGLIATPPSKSHTLRAILFGSLANGKSTIYNYLHSPDTNAMVQACRIFGSNIDVFPTHIEIQGLAGKINCIENVINAGNSGIVLRFCSALGALSKQPFRITGDHSIRNNRPMSDLLNGLKMLGVEANSTKKNGYAPVNIKGPIKSGKAILDGQDSQPVSAIIIAAAFAENPIELEIINPGEIPWVSLTLGWLDWLEIPYENNDFKNLKLYGNARFDGFEYYVPGDFSSAAFPIVAALITQSEITLQNIDMEDSQGDKELISILQQMGGNFEFDSSNKSLHVKKSELSGTKVDINNFVDAITILSVVGCFADGETLLYNGAIAKQKECNRIRCITTELRKMGATIEETSDGLFIKKSKLLGTEVFSHDDHRMAMSLSVAGLGAQGETIVKSTDCISKTYPNFLSEFNLLGAKIVALP